MKLWHPHTELPNRATSVLIALPPADHEAPEDAMHCLTSDLHDFHPHYGFTSADTGKPIRFAAYFWAYESDVLHELDAQLQEVTS